MTEQSKALSKKQAKTLRMCILALCVISLICIFQPFSLALFTMGSIGVILGGLIFNVMPFCQEGVPIKTIIKTALTIAYILIGFIAIASLVSYLYIIAFLGT